MSDATISLLVLLATIILFTLNRLPVGLVAVACSLALYFTGVLDADQALAGFGDPVVVFIATLFIVAEGIDSTGVTTWTGQQLVERAGEDRGRLLVTVMLLCALMTAVISLNGSVAALMPMVVVLARRIGQPPGQMLMPMAFAGSAGSLLLLTGSPVNVLVAETSRDNGFGFGFFDFAVIGIPVLAGTLVLALWLGPKVLPARTSDRLPPDLSRHAAVLGQQYSLSDGFYRLRVSPESDLVGTPLATMVFAEGTGVSLIGIQARNERHALDHLDVLVVAGETQSVAAVVDAHRLTVASAPVGVQDHDLFSRDTGVAELVVPPRSPLVGQVVFPGQLRAEGLMILAVQRGGHDRGPRQTALATGDTILVRGPWSVLEGLNNDRDILVVDSADVIRRQLGPLGPLAWRAVGALSLMVVLLAFGIVPPAIAGLIAAGAMVLTGVLTVDQAYRSVSWQAIVLIGGLIPMSTAISTSGAADQIAARLVDLVGSGSPYLIMTALFVLTGALGQVINNTATVLVVLPIAVAMSAETGISAQPLLMLVAVAGAASLLTPISTPGNMMVMGPGAYRFGDYWRLGLPIMAWWLVASVTIIPLVWSF